MIILRVDDRLIHGQVIAGWVRPLGIQAIILASDKLSRDEWACNAYRLAVPEGIEFSCFDITGCVHHIKKNNESNKNKIMIIVESVKEASELIKEGLHIKEINIGGLGYKDGSREVAPYIYLSVEDIESVVYLNQLGIKVMGKQLPNSSVIDVVKKLTGIR